MSDFWMSDFFKVVDRFHWNKAWIFEIKMWSYKNELEPCIRRKIVKFILLVATCN